MSSVPPAPPMGANPYAAPRSMAEPGYTAGATVDAGGPIHPTRIVAGDVVNEAWAIFKSRMGDCILAIVVVGIVSWLANVVLQLVFGTIAQNANNDVITVVASIMNSLSGIVISAWLEAGLLKLLLNVVRGRPARVGEVFNGGAAVVPLILARLLTSIAIGFGFVLLIIPGVYLLLMWSQIGYLIVDRGLGVMDSMRVSAEITQGNKLSVLALGLMAFAINLLGLLACCVGLLISAPFTAIIFAVAYVRMIGQGTALSAPPEFINQ